MYCHWRSSYQEGGGPINQVNLHTFLCLSKARTWISNIIYSGLFCAQCVQIRWEVIVHFVDIGGIDDYHCLSFPFICDRRNDEEKSFILLDHMCLLTRWHVLIYQIACDVCLSIRHVLHTSDTIYKVTYYVCLCSIK